MSVKLFRFMIFLIVRMRRKISFALMIDVFAFDDSDFISTFNFVKMFYFRNDSIVCLLLDCRADKLIVSYNS